jgi:hypothetical protein
MMRIASKVIVSSVLLLGSGIGQEAQACTTVNWLGGSSNAVADSPPNTTRFSQYCSYEASGTSHVQSNDGANAHYFGRFYVFPETSGSGTADVLVAYSDEVPSAVLFKISYDGTNFIYDAAGASGGSTTIPAVDGWNLLEFEFNSGAPFNVWQNEMWDHNTQAYTSGPSDTFASGTGTVEAVRLGTPNGMGGLGGMFSFDAFEAHRTTNVGALLDCDAEGDAQNADVDINDALAVLDESFGLPKIYAFGQPDCDRNGSVDINDALEVLEIVFPSP